MNNLTSGKLARLAKVNIETIRYYERRGLLPKPTRTASGFRLYGDSDISRLKFIQMAKSHGFQLREIKELLDLRVDPDSSCIDVQHRADEKLAQIEVKIDELFRIKRALEKLRASCTGETPMNECPIITAFEHP